MLESAGALLRAWRTARGATQAEVAAMLGVSASAVRSWERDTHRIPLELLERLDARFEAGGCLTDLIRAIGTPSGFAAEPTGSAGKPVPQPRRYWAGMYQGPPQPAWAWLRPGTGLRVSAYAYSGPAGMRVDQECGPDGVFLVAPYHDPSWPYHVVMAEPGWVDYGVGVPPEWLGQPRLNSARLRDLVIVNPREPWIAYFIAEFRRRDRGQPQTLRDRLRAMVRPEVWDPIEKAIRANAPMPAGARLDLPAGQPRPPAAEAARRAQHRRLRQARGMSQTDAATAVTRLQTAPHAAAPRTPAVTVNHIHDYESGRSSRVRYLPALLDTAYRAFGWTCYEPVPARSIAQGLHEVRFPGFWAGPVCLAVTPRERIPADGSVTFSWTRWKLERELAGQPAAFTFALRPGEPTLRVRVPPGWSVSAHMGQNPDAQAAYHGWMPVDQAAGEQIFDAYTTGFLRLLGRTQAELNQALGIPLVTSESDREPRPL